MPPIVTRAAGGPENARDHPDGGRLPRAVGAEQAEELAAGHVQVDAVDRGELAVALGELVQPDHVILRTMASTTSRSAGASTTIRSSGGSPSLRPRKRLHQELRGLLDRELTVPGAHQRCGDARETPVARALPGGHQRAPDLRRGRPGRARPR